MCGANEECTERVDGLIRAATVGAPPLAEDRVAAMLGLVPDKLVSLDSASLKRALKSADIRASRVAATLASRGWQVTTRDVVEWLAGNAGEVSPALIAAIANAIGLPSDRLTTAKPGTSPRSLVERIAERPAFAELVERFAAVRGVATALAASSLRSAVSTMAFRSGPPDEDAALAALSDMVRAMEDREG